MSTKKAERNEPYDSSFFSMEEMTLVKICFIGVLYGGNELKTSIF